MTITAKRLASVRQTSQLYPAFSISSLRWLIFNRQQNGFIKCVRKIGAKVVIDLDLFEEFVDTQQAGGV